MKAALAVGDPLFIWSRYNLLMADTVKLFPVPAVPNILRYQNINEKKI